MLSIYKTDQRNLENKTNLNINKNNSLNKFYLNIQVLFSLNFVFIVIYLNNCGLK